ncbi:MAG: diaminopimelate epimerase [candidate division Zixibacteria bacterium HGW-Zixibacteria-1]|nr:MAG: diaminopimelate epimerase [candidate division Zixibacteria bacterium HGW-Zixibacteria-1]
MKKIEFYKYHGLGNDFLIIDLMKKRPAVPDYNKLAEKICNRSFGVGADGILVLTKSRRADCCIDLFNSDGSWAEKSGNGLRIVAAYFHSNYARKKKLAFEINDEIADAEIIKSGSKGFSIKVSLGKPDFETKRVPMKSNGKFHINAPIEIEKTKFPVTVLSVGNPHTVLFVDRFDFDWKELGKIIEHSKYFPHRTNVEFVNIVSRSKVVLNDWERGAGATGSSGTGAAAAVVAGVVNGYINRKVEVVFPAGSLYIDWSEKDDNIYLTGPVAFICKGEYLFDAE